MLDDIELLRRYASEHSEDAFGELVQRHLNLVYYAALRQVGGDADSARDVTQIVFTDLARKAKILSARSGIVAWLYTSTRFTAAKEKRSQLRRRSREHLAHAMQEITHESANPETDWGRLRPVIDDVLHELNESDQEAVLLRYFEGKSYGEVGARLRIAEDTARVRVSRALDKLHQLLRKRGITLTTAALATALGSQAAIAAPIGIAGPITSGAIAAAGSGLGGIGAVTTYFALMTKSKITLVVAGVTLSFGIAAMMSSAAGPTPQAVQDPAVNDVLKWTIFVPPGSEEAKITLTQSNLVSPSGSPVIQFGSDRFARFGIMPNSEWMAVQAGETVRLSAWVKSDNPPVEDSRARGVLLRATLRNDRDVDYPQGHFYVGTQGVVLGAPNKFKSAGDTSAWTKLEGVVVVPPGVTRIKFFVFGWWTSGNIYMSDAQITRAEAGTPASPLVEKEPAAPFVIP